MSGLDFNDDAQRMRHQQIIAICLANTIGDLINGERVDWHCETQMNPPATKEEKQAAVAEYVVITDWVKAYREFYGEGRSQ